MLLFYRLELNYTHCSTEEEIKWETDKGSWWLKRDLHTLGLMESSNLSFCCWNSVLQLFFNNNSHTIDNYHVITGLTLMDLLFDKVSRIHWCIYTMDTANQQRVDQFFKTVDIFYQVCHCTFLFINDWINTFYICMCSFNLQHKWFVFVVVLNT